MLNILSSNRVNEVVLLSLLLGKIRFSNKYRPEGSIQQLLDSLRNFSEVT